MVKIFHPNQVKALDDYTIIHEPISSIELMERAAMVAVTYMEQGHLINQEGITHLICGPGNNGGDGLAIARILQSKGYQVKVYTFNYSSTSNDFAYNLKRLPEPPIIIDNPYSLSFEKKDVILDCLFGVGLSRRLEGQWAELVTHLNQVNTQKIAVDMPSGLFASKSSKGSTVLKADYTLSFQFPKLSFLFPENAHYCGRWQLIPIGLHEKAIESTATPYNLLEESDITPLIKERGDFGHKGNFGRALIMAGSKGKMGAAVMAAKASLRSGLGLLSMHVPAVGEPIVQSTVLEAMVDTDSEMNYLSELKAISEYDSIGVGPGIGTRKETMELMKHLLEVVKVPLVIDADGLNILAKNKELLAQLPVNSILTPHPKEFERLVGEWENNFERLEKQREFSKNYQQYVILKGKYTSITNPEGKVYFNSTGNVGMATGGSGDVLTGILTSFLAQGYTNKEACLLGVYIHGLAGDIAADKFGNISMLPTDLIECIPEAFNKLRA